MKAIFYYYDLENLKKVKIFETKLIVVPKKNSEIYFPYEGDMHYGKIVSIEQHFTSKGEFSHLYIDVKF